MSIDTTAAPVQDELLWEELPGGLLRVTTDWSRWYYDLDYVPHPSTTWVGDVGIPKGYGYKKWLGDQLSLEHAEREMQAGGRRGSAVHWGIDQMLRGREVSQGDVPRLPHREEPFTVTEWSHLTTWARWYHKHRASIGEIVTVEHPMCVSRGDIEAYPHWHYGFQLDCIMRFDGALTLFDWKTSRSVYDTHKTQLGSMVLGWNAHHPDLQIEQAKIVLTNAPTKQGFSFRTVDIMDGVAGFDAAYRMWRWLVKDPAPKVRHFPKRLSIEPSTAEVLEGAL